MLPRGDLPAPIEPQVWHFRQSIDYSVTANYSILDLARAIKRQLLYNIYKMGEEPDRARQQGSLDDLERRHGARCRTRWPAARSRPAARRGGRGGRGGGGRAAARRRPRRRRRSGQRGGAVGRGGATDAQLQRVLKDSRATNARSARLHHLRRIRPTSRRPTKFINTLRYVGVDVDQATAPFTVNGKQYPAGSYVVKTAQAGRAHVLDMFEPQDHPNDLAYPGGTAAPSVRQRRLDARLPDGREVRSHDGRRSTVPGTKQIRGTGSRSRCRA